MARFARRQLRRHAGPQAGNEDKILELTPERLPVRVKAGSVALVHSPVQSTVEKPLPTLALQIYRGDGVSTSNFDKLDIVLHGFGDAMQAFFLDRGAVIASLLPVMFDKWFNVSNAAVGGLVFFLAISWTVFSAAELPPPDLDKFKTERTHARRFDVAVKDIIGGFARMPKTMGQVARLFIHDRTTLRVPMAGILTLFVNDNRPARAT